MSDEASKTLSSVSRLARDLYCTRSPFVWSEDCDQIKGYRRSEWCPSCRIRHAVGIKPRERAQ